MPTAPKLVEPESQPSPEDYSPPLYTHHLGKGGQLVAWAIRSIVSAAQENRVTPPCVESVLATAGAPGAIFAITDLLSAVARGARRPITVAPEKHDTLFPDEQLLMQSLAGVQRHPGTCQCRPVRMLCHDSAVREVMTHLYELAGILSRGELSVLASAPANPAPTLH